MIRELMLREYIRNEISRLLDENVDISKIMKILSEDAGGEETGESVGYSESIKDIQSAMSAYAGTGALLTIATMGFLNSAARAGTIVKANQVAKYRLLMGGAAATSTATTYTDILLANELFSLASRQDNGYLTAAAILSSFSALTNGISAVFIGRKAFTGKSATIAAQLKKESDDIKSDAENILLAAQEDFNKKLIAADKKVGKYIKKEIGTLKEMNEALVALDDTTTDSGHQTPNVDLNTKVRDFITKLYKFSIVETRKKEDAGDVESAGEAKIEIESISLTDKDVDLMFSKLDEMIELTDKDGLATMTQNLLEITKQNIGLITFGLALTAGVFIGPLIDHLSSITALAGKALAVFGKTSTALNYSQGLTYASAILLVANAIYGGKRNFFNMVMNSFKIGEAELSTSLAIINLNKSLRGKKFKLTSADGLKQTTYTVLGVTPKGVQVAKGATVNAPPGRTITKTSEQIRQDIADVKSGNNIGALNIENISSLDNDIRTDIIAGMIQSIDEGGNIHKRITDNVALLNTLSAETDSSKIKGIKEDIILDISIYDQYFSSFVGGKESGSAVNDSKLSSILQITPDDSSNFRESMKKAIQVSGYDTTLKVDGMFINPYDSVSAKRAGIKSILTKSPSLMDQGGGDVGPSVTGTGGGMKTNIASLKTQLQGDTVTLQQEINETGSVISFDAFIAGINATEREEGNRIAGIKPGSVLQNDGGTQFRVAYKQGAAEENYTASKKPYDESEGGFEDYTKNAGLTFSEFYGNKADAIFDDSGTARKATFARLIDENVEFTLVHGQAEAGMQTDQMTRIFLGEGGDPEKLMVSYMRSYVQFGNKKFYQNYLYGSVLAKLILVEGGMMDRAAVSIEELQITSEAFDPEKIEGTQEDFELFMQLMPDE